MIASSAQLHIDQLVTFPNFAENIAVRWNGDILVTSVTTPSVQYLDSAHPNVTTLAPIPNANGLSGISEIEKDLFAVAAGIWNITTRRSEQMTIWTLDFRHSSAARPILRKIVDVVNATALNGMAALPGSSIILAAESNLGAVYRIDVARRTYAVMIQDEKFAPTGPAPSLGINGVRIHGSELYFANSATGFFGRVPISSSGFATGPLQLVSQFNYDDPGTEAIDDFGIDNAGNAWVCLHPQKLVRVDPEGRQYVVVDGNGLSHPTSLAFGRGYEDRKKVYITTNILGADIVGGVAAIGPGLTSSEERTRTRN